MGGRCCQGCHTSVTAPITAITASTAAAMTHRCDERPISARSGTGAGMVGAVAAWPCSCAASARRGRNQRTGRIDRQGPSRGLQPAPGRGRRARGGCLQGRRWSVEVAADDGRWVGFREELRSGQEMVGAGRQRVLIGAPVDVCTHQLLRRSIGHRSHRHVGGGQPADVGQLARYPEVANRTRRSPSSGSVSKMLAGLTSRCSSPR